jgi:hypothetical protein
MRRAPRNDREKGTASILGTVAVTCIVTAVSGTDRRLPTLAGVAVLTAALLSRPVQAATPACSSLPNPVYLQAADTSEPALKAIGQQLRANTPKPITIIYSLNGSCTNIDAMYNNTKLTVNPNYVPSQTDVPGWDPTQPSPQCTIDPAGVPLDLVSSAIFINSCTTQTAPAAIETISGAAEPYVFVTPQADVTDLAITAEEAYFVFGFGANDQVTPWNDPAFMFIRTSTKGTQVAMGASIHVPPAKWQGVALSSSSSVVNAVATSTSPQKTIGILGGEVFDQNRNTLNALAFRAFSQNHAYYPDSTSPNSTSGTKDKRNVRDGHYVIWSRYFYLAPTDILTGAIDNPNAEYLLDMLTDRPASPMPAFDPLATIISVGQVPDCAMTVTRSSDGGDFSLYAPAAPCGCFFESQVGAAPASCVACSAATPCSSGTCRHGFCEAR